jgi:hypothetical protein
VVFQLFKTSRRFQRMKKAWFLCILLIGAVNLCFSQELDTEKNNINLYKSVDVSLMSDIAPYNVTFNIGIEKIYGSLIVSYYPTFSPKYETKYTGIGFGIGSNILINKNIYFNPKIMGIFTLENKNTTFSSLKTDFGYQINSFFSIFLGTGITWINHPVEHYDFHFIGIPYLGRTEINEKNSIIFLGTEIGIKIKF